MALRAIERLPDLYERDETAWLETMAELIRMRRLDELDYSHLGEFLQDMAKRDRREARNRLTVLIAHILKWLHQPERRGRSWQRTMETQRQKLLDIFESATLRAHAAEVMPDIYRRAVRMAMIETGLPESAFPDGCPFTLDEALSFDVVAE